MNDKIIKVIKELLNLLKNGETQPEIRIDDDKYNFITAWYQNALLVYKSTSWGGANVTGRDYSSIGIFFDSKFYITDGYRFWGYNHDPSEDDWKELNLLGIYRFSDFTNECVKEINRKIDEIAYQIPVSEELPEDFDEKAYQFIWKQTILARNRNHKPAYYMHGDDDINLLVGVVTTDGLAQKFYDENAEDIQEFRMLYEYSKSKYDLTDCPYVKLYDRLSNMRAKNIECTFRNGDEGVMLVFNRYSLVSALEYTGKFGQIPEYVANDREDYREAISILGVEKLSFDLLVKAKYKKEVLFDTENPDYDKPVVDWMQSIVNRAS